MKYTLTLQQSGPFAQSPRFAELEGDKILTNDVILPKVIDPENAFNPHNVGLWVIGHEFGAICAVWASGPQDALDAACDAGMLGCLAVSEAAQADADEREREEWAGLGNASEPHDLTYAWIACVEWEAARDIHLIVGMVRAVENQRDNLGD